ncbi:MAG: energy-coupled thiamine transporter ThiT [Candidatus Eremiobacteraeota bacterium]|nr:energy-coupled thiamine transporter ThiT [Candidatus Eremiobacteraeota bacterium]
MKCSMVEIGLTVGLALFLAAFRLFHMPMGGEFSLAILPILVLALWRGIGPGMMAGLIFGLAHFVQDPFVVHPAQFILDYPLAHTALGIGGIFSKFTPSWKAIIPGVFLGACLDFLCHMFSGVIFINLFLPSIPENINWLGFSFPFNPWLYSFLYNASYMIPELVASMILGIPLLSALRKAIK